LALGAGGTADCEPLGACATQGGQAFRIERPRDGHTYTGILKISAQIGHAFCRQVCQEGWSSTAWDHGAFSEGVEQKSRAWPTTGKLRDFIDWRGNGIFPVRISDDYGSRTALCHKPGAQDIAPLAATTPAAQTPFHEL